MKPVAQQFIEALHSESRCPRMTINAQRAGVVVPDFVREEWGERLPIDLDPDYPLELKMDDDGLTCTLSFGGPFECYFPWPAIYAIQDRETSLGMVFEAFLPEDWSVVQGQEDGAPSADTLPTPMLAPVASEDSVGEADEPAGDQHNPAALRAAFKVIDGGKS